MILEHPMEYVQEGKLPGQLSSARLEEYETGKYLVQLRSNRDRYYLRKWFLSKVITFGNIGEQEKILAAIVFDGHFAMEQLFFFLIRRIKNRKVSLVKEAYELCRNLYPNLFPRLPDVKDSRIEPQFWVITMLKRTRLITKPNRPRNPSACGGKHRQGLSSLPMFQSGDPGPSNVADVFLEMLNFLENRTTLTVWRLSGLSAGLSPFTEENQKFETERNKCHQYWS